MVLKAKFYCSMVAFRYIIIIVTVSWSHKSNGQFYLLYHEYRSCLTLTGDLSGLKQNWLLI